MNHAFFKALLFLSAGALIHAFFDEQDTRQMGRFKNLFPFIYMCLFIGSLAIMGFPFLAGFYSKDLISEFAFSRSIVNSSFVYSLGLLAAICTSSTPQNYFMWYFESGQRRMDFSDIINH